MKTSENRQLSKALKQKGLSIEEKDKLKGILNQNKNEQVLQENQEKIKEVKSVFKKRTLEGVKKGQTPFFPKKSKDF